ncbi:MAG: hypothetical protein PHO83_14810 [Geobacteraceae bacterium]|nr:hypothetical protein [Geobacteraceae bacterium]
MPRTIFTSLKIALLVCITLLLSGCFEIDYTIKINPDGTENITTKVTLPGIFAAQAGEVIQKFKEAGYGVITKTEGDKFLIIGSKTLKDYRWELPMVTDAKNEKFSPAVKNWLFFKTYEFSGEYFIENDKKFRDPNNPYDSMQIPIRYTIELPGTVQRSNAANVSGTTLKWEFNYAAQSEHVVINAKSYSINYAAIVVGIIVLLGIGIPAIVRPALRRQAASILIVIFVGLPTVLFLMNREPSPQKNVSAENKTQAPVSFAPQQSQKTTETGSQRKDKIKTIPSFSSEKIAQLNTYIGEYQNKGFHVLIKPELSKLVGSNYEALVKNVSVASQIKKNGNYVIIEGCAPHMCDSDRGIILIDTSTGILSAALMIDSKVIGKYSDIKDEDNYPETIKYWETTLKMDQ